jgi:hypothetical protein
VAFDKEDGSSNPTDLQLYQVEKHPRDHSVLVLAGTVVEYQVYLSRCSPIAKFLQVKELPYCGGNRVASFLPFSYKEEAKQ